VNDEQAVIWLLRRAGFGVHPARLDADLAAGPGALLDTLVDPDVAGVPLLPDPWDDERYRDYQALEPEDRLAFTSQFVDRVVASERGLEDWMTFFWHDHFAVRIQVVRLPLLMAGHMRLLQRHALGNFADLLRDVTTDAAMLVYLDGARSTGGDPNENYGRELLELFSLGVGNYTEDDVRAATVALTGWTVQQVAGEVTFVPRRHDPTPQTLLGESVSDVDSVIDAVLAHPACGPFIAGKLAGDLLGPEVDQALVDRLGRDFAADGYEIAPLVRAVLEAGLDGAGGEMIGAPFPWLVAALRASGARLPDQAKVGGAALLGQVPFSPPNVAGWPDGDAWLASSSLVARFRFSAGIAATAPPESALRAAAADRRFDDLALLLGRADGFSRATLSGFDQLADATGTGVLAAALNAPDLILV
jgi:uncharacterized protein (DUF1800 family)